MTRWSFACDGCVNTEEDVRFIPYKLLMWRFTSLDSVCNLCMETYKRKWFAHSLALSHKASTELTWWFSCNDRITCFVIQRSPHSNLIRNKLFYSSILRPIVPLCCDNYLFGHLPWFPSNFNVFSALEAQKMLFFHQFCPLLT